MSEVGADNKVSVVCLGNPGGPWGDESKAYAFEGDLDTSKTYSYGTYLSGINNTASGLGSVASGNECTASGDSSHAEGYSTTASGDYSHAEGYNTTASATGSHAEGLETTASGDSSHAEGGCTTASGEYSHAEGYCTTASSGSQHVQGRYNIDDPDDVYQFIIGNGSDESLSNAFAIKWDGTLCFWIGTGPDAESVELTPAEIKAIKALI